MDSARDRHTGKIIDAMQLLLIQNIDRGGYMCRGCDATVLPIACEPGKKVRPHFRIEGDHVGNCDVEGEKKIIKIAKRKSIMTTEGIFPASFPNRLRLNDVRRVVETNTNNALCNQEATQTHGTTNRISLQNRFSRWPAQTIRPICKTFMNYPYDRHLPLSIPDINGQRYSEVINPLKSGEIKSYPDKKLFYAPISWQEPKINDNYIEVCLSYGIWEEKKLIRPYRVLVPIENLSEYKINYIVSELNYGIAEYKESKDKGLKDKAWLFFIGDQFNSDPSVFYVDDHRLICCLIGQMIRPEYKKSTRRFKTKKARRSSMFS
jgi:hypothetical protein